jgi:hypothetical protein
MKLKNALPMSVKLSYEIEGRELCWLFFRKLAPAQKFEIVAFTAAKKQG